MIFNWNDIDTSGIQVFGKSKRLKYKGECLQIVIDDIIMPFGINKSPWKTNIKFRVDNQDCVNFLQKLDTLASTMGLGGKYEPLVKEWNNETFFLATVQKNKELAFFWQKQGKKSEEQVSEEEFLELIETVSSNTVRAFLEFKYIWTKNNHYGITVIVTDLVMRS